MMVRISDSCGLCRTGAALVAVLLMALGNGCSDDSQGKPDLGGGAADGKADQSKTGDQALTPDGNGGTAFGEIVAFHSTRESSGSHEIYVMNADSTAQTRLTTNSSEDKQPTFSPDGQWIVFSSDRDTPKSLELYRMSREGKDVTRLTTSEGDDTEPSYSWDGTQVVFTTNRDAGIVDKGVTEIYLLKLSDNSLTRLTKDALPTRFNREPSFSPDGKTVVFTSNRDNAIPSITDIYTVDVANLAVKRLTNTAQTAIGKWNCCATYSHDGAKIAFISNRDAADNNGEVYVMNVDGSGITRITDTKEEHRMPHFTKSGRLVFAKAVSGDKYQLFIMDADGKNLTRLTQNAGSDEWPRTAYGTKIGPQ